MRTPGISGSLAFTEGVTTGPFYGQFSPINSNLQANGNITGLPTDGFNTGADSVLFLTGAQSGGVNYQVPSLAAIFASLPPGFASQDIVGASWKLRIINSGTGQTITVVANTGMVIGSGTNTIANNSFRDYVITIVSATSGAAQEIGSGTYP